MREQEQELISIDNLELSPNTGRSNLKIKGRRRMRSKANEEAKARRQSELGKVAGANIIFGIDNGATRDSRVHCPVRRGRHRRLLRQDVREHRERLPEGPAEDREDRLGEAEGLVLGDPKKVSETLY